MPQSNLTGLVSNTLNVANQTTNYTVQPTDSTVTFDSTSGNLVATLFSAVNNAGKVITIKKVDTSANLVTVTPTGGQTMDSVRTTIVLRRQNDFVTLVSNGTNWVILVKKETEVISTTAASGFTGAAISGLYLSAGTASITLTPGNWKITGLMIQKHQVSDPAFVRNSACGFYAANGNNTATVPALLSTLSGLQTDGPTRCVDVWGDGVIGTLSGPIAANLYWSGFPLVFTATVTSTVTIYLVAQFATAGNPGVSSSYGHSIVA